MGVKGLQYYIEKRCPNACVSVSIQQLGDEHRAKFNCQPVIVVDGMSLINRLYAKSFEWIYGGQWFQFVKKLEEFIGIFQNIGVKLVFFFDGTVCAAKRNEWVKRRIAKNEQIKSIFSHINNNNTEPDEKLFQLPTSMGTLTRFALIELGAEVYQTDREADEVIAEYAMKKIEVFAILSQDSDFIIYNTKFYLSLMHLNLQTLITIHYDRYCFAHQYLHINVNQLPLFACLVGNDIIPPQKLNGFHKFLSNYKRGPVYVSDIAENLAHFIWKENLTGDLNTKNEHNYISRTICGDLSLSSLINAGLKYYSVENCNDPPKICIFLHPSTENTVFQRHLQCVNAPFIFNLLCNLEYESSEVLEDNVILPSAIIYRKIRQRCYGVLFNYFLSSDSFDSTITKNKRPILITEWCAHYENPMVKPEYIQPLPLKLPATLIGKPCDIERIWFQFSEEEKLIFFHSIMDLSLEFDTFLSLPRNHMALASILNYLIIGWNERPIIRPMDVAVFIIQALLLKKWEDFDKLKVPWVDSYPIRLSTIFMRGVSAALMALNVCGNPFPVTLAMPWHYFDGKLFHYLLLKARDRTNIYTLCQQKIEVIKEFFWLLKIITSNTSYQVDIYNWRMNFEDFDSYNNL